MENRICDKIDGFRDKPFREFFVLKIQGAEEESTSDVLDRPDTA